MSQVLYVIVSSSQKDGPIKRSECPLFNRLRYDSKKCYKWWYNHAIVREFKSQ
jgi:hypothetical protein